MFFLAGWISGLVLVFILGVGVWWEFPAYFYSYYEKSDEELTERHENTVVRRLHKSRNA